MSREMLETAVRHHQAGRLAEAEALYRQVLAEEPGNAEALHLVGVIAFQGGRPEEALERINRAIQIEPARAEFYGNLGLVLAQHGEIDRAIAALRRALELRPDYPQALSNLGSALKVAGQLDRAPEVYRRWVALRPWDAEGWGELGTALRENGEAEEAADAFRQAIELRGEALEYRKGLVTALAAGNRGEEAAEVGREVVERWPESPEALMILAKGLEAAGKFEQAEAACRKAVALAPESATSHHQLGVALYNLARFDEAMAEYRRALKLDPNFAGAHCDLGTLQILRGNFLEGFAECEWRWKSFWVWPAARFHRTQWRGGELEGRRILLHAEAQGGFGDTIMMARYCASVARSGGRVILQCQPELLGLLRGLPGVEKLIGLDEPEPEHDLHCTLLSLPMATKTTVETIPAAPYLHADAELADRWRQRFVREGNSGTKVGLVWAGGPRTTHDRTRSISPGQLAPLASVSSVQWFRLQKGAAAEQAAHAAAGWRIVDWTNELSDWSQTAALVSNLDLVISVDTAVAHLAGAMGKPVWVLAPWPPTDWRWMLDREDSPWYPTMRIFRQEKRGDWSAPIERVVEELRRLAGR